MSKTRRELLRFAVAGVAGLACDALAFYLALAAGLSLYPARLLSFLCAVTLTWLINRRYTFASAGHPPPAPSLREFVRYLGAMLGGGAINYAVSVLCVLMLPPWRVTPLLAVAAGSLAGMLLNFVSAKLLVFQRT
ncbi:Putative flippase GtrA (transmembrane translocase of bactoprenol-linked glucose) [Duganella sp. CF402]|uniref:GtrA family protein n=1 Tax=unclassified Duganella TaxID=2636909 RepID=UPI0008CACA6F|nr:MULTISPECIES: GtrA family protein [unclassified Duganella]RZT08679.1 putative flippase GtrA [Duganella sp. BK701]SEL85653.1 Putative flippase GtrA (transmembrane translocase of bactoprenol-linked glucose) [Duganella sp. CF402]